MRWLSAMFWVGGNSLACYMAMALLILPAKGTMECVMYSNAGVKVRQTIFQAGGRLFAAVAWVLSVSWWVLNIIHL